MPHRDLELPGQPTEPAIKRDGRPQRYAGVLGVTRQRYILRDLASVTQIDNPLLSSTNMACASTGPEITILSSKQYR